MRSTTQVIGKDGLVRYQTGMFSFSVSKISAAGKSLAAQEASKFG